MKRFVSVVIVLTVLVYGGITANADTDMIQFPSAYLDSVNYSVEQWLATPANRASFAAFATLDMLIYLANNKLVANTEAILEAVDCSTRIGVVAVVYNAKLQKIGLYLFASGHIVVIGYGVDDKTALFMCFTDVQIDPFTVLRVLCESDEIEGYYSVSCADYGIRLNDMLGYITDPKDFKYTKHQLSEAGITIPIPANYYVFKRGLPSYDPVYIQTGIPSELMEAALVEKNEYLNALSPDGSTQITVTMEALDPSGISLLSDDELYNIAIHNVSAIKARGADIRYFDIYHSGNITYIRYWGHTSLESENDYLSYNAFFEDHFITINIFSADGPISAADESLIEYIVNNSTILKSLGTPTPNAP